VIAEAAHPSSRHHPPITGPAICTLKPSPRRRPIERRRSYDAPVRTREPSPTRRQFILQLLATAACGSTGDTDTGGSTTTGDGTGTTDEPTTEVPTTGEPAPTLPGDPFTLGVASGDPLPDSVILWTRLAPTPLAPGGGMPSEPFPVEWELAADEAFADILASGTVDADPAFAHALHIDAGGLAPDTWYWYRFRAGDYTSPVGRTRTTPAFDAQPERLRFATACCQDYSDGYPTPYLHMVEEDVDLVIFLGDYIYENAATGPVRSHGADHEPRTVDEYRVRHALYKTQPELQAMHARCPWIALWDDHEVDNDYATDLPEQPDPEFLERRAAAYRAYYEHTPLRLPPPAGPDYQTYHAFLWGDLAEFWLVDTRQYRDDQNCGGEPGSGCEGWADYDGTVLGDEQEAWLQQHMRDSAAIWKVLTNQIVFSTVSFGGLFVNFDQWDGYPLARQRLLDFLAAEALDNVVILSGDLHIGGVGDIGAIATDDDSPVVAAEIVTTSISSPSVDDASEIGPLVEGLARIRYFNAVSRGYVMHELGREQWKIQCFVVDTVETPTSGGKVEAELYIDVGVPGIRKP
jgi:alkaline phosphatase D